MSDDRDFDGTVDRPVVSGGGVAGVVVGSGVVVGASGRAVCAVMNGPVLVRRVCPERLARVAAAGGAGEGAEMVRVEETAGARNREMPRKAVG